MMADGAPDKRDDRKIEDPSAMRFGNGTV